MNPKYSTTFDQNIKLLKDEDNKFRLDLHNLWTYYVFIKPFT